VAAQRNDVAIQRNDVAAQRNDVAIQRNDVAAQRNDVAIQRNDVAAQRDDMAVQRLRAEREEIDQCGEDEVMLMALTGSLKSGEYIVGTITHPLRQKQR